MDYKKFALLLLFITYVFSNEKLHSEKSHKEKQPKEVIIVGVKDKNILKAIKEQLNTKLENPTKAERSFWIKYNKKEIYRILYSFGYFDAQVKPINSKTIKKFNIILNKRYKLKNINYKYVGNYKCNVKLTSSKIFELLDIKQYSFITTKQLSNGVNKLKNFYKGYGFAFVFIDTPDININKEDKTINVTYYITLNKKVKIRNTIVNINSKKNSKLLEPIVKNRITWKNGDYYDINKINKFKEILVQHNLFAGVDISLSNPIKGDANNDFVDITIFLEEALLRSGEAGAQFNTSDLFSLAAGWSHYNIDGRGSTFSIIGNLSKSEQKLTISHNYYDIFYKNQHLYSKLFGLKENTNSYITTKFGAESMLWQKIGYLWEIGIGGIFDRSKTIDKITKEKNHNYLNTYGLPIGLKIDSTDNSIDPKKGIKLESLLTPYNVSYTTFTGKVSTYLDLSKIISPNKNTILGIYSKYGTIISNESTKIIRDKLYFSGGANSVRGYSYQKLGPLSSLDMKTPIGGKSVVEFGAEIRFKATDTLGGVLFVETGKVFDKYSAEKFMIGWGFGIRYYTPLGPIRLDLAFPTKRRKDINGKYVDSLFNLYISIGQAF